MKFDKRTYLQRINYSGDLNPSLSILKNRSVPFIIVLGYENYYPKLGFEKASKYGIKCQWDGVPDEAFMIRILDDQKMSNIHGLAKYRDELKEAM